ncbi:putative F-box protein At1g55070 [Cornus florida]|uniref:putative F-box protein At1g55070 n=1 Tax=Cornus florida TaxID=4283 RepID=UPI0028A05022|nr:putative F-box protein At1g55070 [Cornus florida]
MGCGNSKSNGKKDSSSFNRLPRDIMYEILTRVAAESLVRFKLVCKLWKTIISHPEFISSHLHIWQSKPSFIFTAADLQSDRLLLSDFEDQDSTDFPIRIPKGYLHIDDSTDGLLLLEGYISGQTKFCVHNPITGSQKLLPPTLNNREIRWGNFFIVHDASIQKYKVVLFIGNPCIIIHDNIHIITVDNDADRGSVEWRELISPSAFCPQGGFNPISVNGILHWLAYTYDNPLQVPFVQSMDIAREEFRPGISLPCQPKSDSYRQRVRLINCNLLEMKGSIYFSSPATDMELELWMLEDLANHIWVKKHTICLLSIVGKPRTMYSFLVEDSFYPIQMMGNHELMIIWHDKDINRWKFFEGKGWYLYNLRSQELKAIVGRTPEVKECYYRSSRKITHVNSLVGWN